MSGGVLSVDPGQVGNLDEPGLTNAYADISDKSLDSIAERVAPRQVASGMTRGIQQLGSEQVYSDGGNQQIIVEDTADPRVLMGNHASLGEGFFVSKPGIDVKTNKDPANFIFNSAQNVFKIINSNSLTLDQMAGAAGSFTSSSIELDTGIATKIPLIVLGFISTDGVAYTPLPYARFELDGVGRVGGVTYRINISSRVNTDTGTLIVSVDGTNYGSGARGPFIIKFYVLQETAG